MNRLIHRSWGESNSEEFFRLDHESGWLLATPGMQQPPKEEGVTYLCVTDVQITDRRMGKPLGQPAANLQASATGPKVQQMRMVGHVRQKDLDIPEATTIVTEKISTGIAGMF